MRLHFTKSFVTILAALGFALSSNAIAATCIPVDGLTFEKVGNITLMIIQNGKNYGLMNISATIPHNFTVRFFTPTVCDDYSANANFQINGALVTVSSISIFK